MRVAILDIGTNTVLLLIAEKRGDALHVVSDHHAIARLGEGVDRTRTISEAACQRFITVLREHKRVIDNSNCDKIAAIATSAMRDASNRDEIIQRTFADSGIQIELLSGDDEALWTFRGGLAGMETAGNVAVLDIGGGSTEIAFGSATEFRGGTSFDIGAVRITERFFSDGVSHESRQLAAEEIRNVLRGASVTDLTELIAVAGTPTTLAAMDQELTMFDASKVHGYRLTRNAVQRLMDIQFAIDTDALLSQFPCVNRARADILPAGTLILAEAMDRLGASTARVSTLGLRYGIALRELA